MVDDEELKKSPAWKAAKVRYFEHRRTLLAVFELTRPHTDIQKGEKQ